MKHNFLVSFAQERPRGVSQIFQFDCFPAWNCCVIWYWKLWNNFFFCLGSICIRLVNEICEAVKRRSGWRERAPNWKKYFWSSNFSADSWLLLRKWDRAHCVSGLLKACCGCLYTNNEVSINVCMFFENIFSCLQASRSGSMGRAISCGGLVMLREP